MDIYTTTNYRKIWEHFNGSIPKDEQGRSYEIHHIDGNHSNNHIDNLQSVSIQEHYNIHYGQEDWAACMLIAKRMSQIEMPREVKSFLARQNALKRVEQGTNPFTNSEFQRKNAIKRVEKGTHHFLGGEIQRQSNLKRSQNGTHPFSGGEIQKNVMNKMLENGTHPAKVQWVCPHCGKEGQGMSNYNRWHGDKCKFKI